MNNQVMQREILIEGQIYIQYGIKTGRGEIRWQEKNLQPFFKEDKKLADVSTEEKVTEEAHNQTK